MGAVARVGGIAGFRVGAHGGRIGWVEEMWVDDEGETTAVVVRLPNAQRGLLGRDDSDETLSEEATIAGCRDDRLPPARRGLRPRADPAEVRAGEPPPAVRPGAGSPELEPPHLGTAADGAL